MSLSAFQSPHTGYQVKTCPSAGECLTGLSFLQVSFINRIGGYGLIMVQVLVLIEPEYELLVKLSVSSTTTAPLGKPTKLL